jgi:predicted transcriptional regulator of viral defense system
MKFQDFVSAIDKPYFSSMDITLRQISVYPHQLSLWKRQGKIASLRRGLYFFAHRKEALSRELVASLLYDESYISLESALSYYGFIPEMVYTETLVTSKTNRKFSNVFGTFLYRHVQAKLLFGYDIVESDAGKYRMAQPEKALLDYFYLNLGRIQGIDDILELRLNYHEIAEKIDRKKFLSYREQFRVQKLNRITDLLLSLC